MVGAFRLNKVNEFILFLLIEYSNFFCRKAPRQCPAGLFFEKLVGGLEANNYTKDHLIKVIGKAILAIKK